MNGSPLTGITLFLGAIALSLCTFMQVLDYSIANVSIPYIAGDLATSVNDGTWVITMFAVGNAIALPLTGLLTRRLGSIRVMVLSVALFTLFSWLCGMSINMNMLVIMRFIQGVVAGPMIPLSQSLMIMTFPKEKRNLALALWNMVAVVGPIAGPILPVGFFLSMGFAFPAIMVSDTVSKRRQGQSLGTNQSLQVFAEAATALAGGFLWQKQYLPHLCRSCLCSDCSSHSIH